MNDATNTTTGLVWEGAEGAWGATAHTRRFEVIKQGGNWVLWVNGVCHYDRYYFATDAMTEAETLAATAPAIDRADLDWVCITHRALEAAPTSDTLWAQSVTAMRGLIAAIDRAAYDEAHAAHGQYLVNQLIATGLDYDTRAVAERGERIKDALEAIGAGTRLDALRLL
jgi:hypothetical protein